jgi:MATE family multidrug resistance protein
VLKIARCTWHEVRSVWDVGAPCGAQFLLEVGSFAMLAVLVSSFGEAQMAAHQVALQVIHFTFLPLVAVADAGSVLAGQAVGAGRLDLVRPVAHRALATAGGYAVFCTLLLVAFGGMIAEVFVDVPALQATARQLLYVAAIFQIFDASNIVARGILKGTGDVRYAAVIGIACAWAFAPTLTYLLGSELGMGAVGAWLALCVEIIVGAALFWLRLVRRFPQPKGAPAAVLASLLSSLHAPRRKGTTHHGHPG